MSKKVSPTMIGGFVVGALLVLVIAVIVLGSGRLFRQTRDFVLYFDTSVNGLRVGAPVKFKGVEIGAVKDIRLQLEDGADIDKIPVIVEIDLEKLTARGATEPMARDVAGFQDAVLKRGLRGQLLMESMVTGLLYVALDFFPGTPFRIVQQGDGQYRYPEIPTTPTTLELAQDAVTQIFSKLEEIDFKSIIKSLSETVDGMNQLVNSPDLKASLRTIQQTMRKVDAALLNVQTLTITMDGSVTALTASLEQTSEAARDAMQQASLAIKQTEGALKATEAAMVNVNGIMDQDSPTFHEMRKSMREVSAAARSLRLLSGYIERNPRALLFGKPDDSEGR